MCGIVGLFDTRGKREIDRQLLARMNQTQVHRGPDEGELYTEPGIGFGHRRLSIMDVSSGQQPLFNEDGSVVVVFNGEIYNFQELAKELIAAAIYFVLIVIPKSSCMPGRSGASIAWIAFVGMFAFGLWDRNRKSCFWPGTGSV